MDHKASHNRDAGCSWFRQAKQGFAVRVYVQPAASCEQIMGLYDERLRIRVKAAAESGAANKALVALLAKRLKIRKQDVRLQHGLSSRRKTLLVINCSKQAILDLVKSDHNSSCG